MHRETQRAAFQWNTRWAAAALIAGAFGLAVGFRAARSAPSAPQPAALPDWSALGTVRKAAPAWKARTGPKRQVVDVVCLAPDLPTYLTAVATWDKGHYFPVLIEDDKYTPKFIEAFRPARIVRFPKAVAPIPAETLWQEAVAAVGKAWTSGARGLPGDKVPTALGPTPAGVVVSAPGSPALAGAVALAAGRFQPLARWRPEKGFHDRLTSEDAQRLALDLEKTVTGTVPKYTELGDDLDFVTLALDYPYRYELRGQDFAVDDLLARKESKQRWGYAARLMGDPAASAYRAMCSLFLQPNTALLFNTYSGHDQPGTVRVGMWETYSHRTAAAVLATKLPVVAREGEKADQAAWKETFGAKNPFGLVFINSSGGPTNFSLKGGGGATADVPDTVPTVVYKIHSFSAAAPHDPNTLAGRWLANGDFIYYGSMNEPYLQSFRTPTLVTTLIAEGLPFSAAMRKADPCERESPWRLVYLGDPLYRLQPLLKRLGRWSPVDRWPAKP